jgi:predicted dehydrogenase
MSNLVPLKVLKKLKIVEIKQFENTERDRPPFSNRYLKIFYFLLNEGVLKTLRKYRAHSIAQNKYLTFLVVEINKAKHVNVSIQYQKNPAEFVINNNFHPISTIDYTNIEEKLNFFWKTSNQYAQNGSAGLLNIDDSNAISLEVTQEKYEDTCDQGLFVYGLGGYVRMFIIHHFRGLKKLACIDYKSTLTNEFKIRYGFKFGFFTPYCSLPLLKTVKHPVVIIATYHSDHASLAYEIYKTNPNATTFIEKPPAVTLEDLEKLIELFNNKANIEIGFNRRFTHFSKYVKEKIRGKPATITCSIKEVLINENHWYLWKNQGTRITGNVVHWFDLANWWIESKPVEINVMANSYDQESCSVSVLYQNGSILNITASDKGNSLRGVQEKIEIRFGNETIFIDDFTLLTHIKENGVKIKKRKIIRDKGHDAMYKHFMQIIEGNKVSSYSVFDLINTSVVTFYASQMLINSIRNLNIEKEIEKYVRKVVI